MLKNIVPQKYRGLDVSLTSIFDKGDIDDVNHNPFRKKRSRNGIIVPSGMGMFVILLCIGSPLLSYEAVAAQTTISNGNSTAVARLRNRRKMIMLL